jgi:2-oxoglutarate ferredoxin oxidoreductase subunit delta
VKILIDETYCKGCGLCITVCPQHALAPGSRRSPKGYLMPATADDKCDSCKSCEIICPDFAIVTVKEP